MQLKDYWHKAEALFLSDGHAFEYSNASLPHLKFLYTMREAPHVQSVHHVGDFIDFEYIVTKLQTRGLKPQDFPVNFDVALELISNGDARTFEYQKRIIDAYMHFANERNIYVEYTIGNHDHAIEGLTDQTINGITIKKDSVYKDAVNNRNIYIYHGHGYDKGYENGYGGWYGLACNIYNYGLLIDIGIQAASILTRANRIIPSLSEEFRIAKALKRLAKQSHMRPFIQKAVDTAHAHGCDIAMCGHIHTPTLTIDKGYMNTGDGVLNGTGIVHGTDGSWNMWTRTDLHGHDWSTVMNKRENPFYNQRKRTNLFLKKLWEHIIDTRSAVRRPPYINCNGEEQNPEPVAA